MPAWPGSPPEQTQRPEPASPPPALQPELVDRALAPQPSKPPAAVNRKRSSVPEARELLQSKAEDAARAILNLAGIGDDPGLAAADEAVRAHMLRDAADRMGLSVPSVSVVAHVPLDSESALADLERILGVAE